MKRYLIKKAAVKKEFKSKWNWWVSYPEKSNMVIEDPSIYNTDYLDEAKEFAYEQIDYLEGAFEDYPINNMFSIQTISPIRPLHETVNGGYMYRYEFDLTIGYNEERITNKDYGKSVNVEGDIIFNVTIDDNDNIEIET
jgi:hypothetical protein